MRTGDELLAALRPKVDAMLATADAAVDRGEDHRAVLRGFAGDFVGLIVREIASDLIADVLDSPECRAKLTDALAARERDQ